VHLLQLLEDLAHPLLHSFELGPHVAVTHAAHHEHAACQCGPCSQKRPIKRRAEVALALPTTRLDEPEVHRISETSLDELALGEVIPAVRPRADDVVGGAPGDPEQIALIMRAGVTSIDHA
jgi:hypothetical protein